MKKFETIKWANGLEWLKLEPRALNEGILYAAENKIKNFICHWHPLDAIKDFSVLEKSVVTGLNISFSGIISNESINKFSNLKVLICLFSEPVTLLHFSKLSQLEVLEITYNNKIEGLYRLVNLKELRLWKYRPKTKDLKEFNGYAQIKKMMLVQPVINSLDGIQALNQLVELEITRPKTFNLFFKSPHQKNLLHLKILILCGCKELDVISIPVLENLITLTITDSGKISTLRQVIEQFPNLRTLIFTQTELLDGNLHYLLDHPTLEKVIIDHKKHYNMKEKEINAILAEKRGKK